MRSARPGSNPVRRRRPRAIESCSSCSSVGSSVITGSSCAQPGDALHDLPAERDAHGGDERRRVLRLRRLLGERLADRADVADRHAIGEQLLQHLDDDAQRQRLRHQILDELRRGLREAIEQLLHLLVAEQLVRVASAAADSDASRSRCSRRPPCSRASAPARAGRGRSRRRRGRTPGPSSRMPRIGPATEPGIDREVAARLHLGLADRRAENRDAVGVRRRARGCRGCARAAPGSRAPRTASCARP